MPAADLGFDLINDFVHAHGQKGARESGPQVRRSRGPTGACSAPSADVRCLAADPIALLGTIAIVARIDCPGFPHV